MCALAHAELLTGAGMGFASISVLKEPSTDSIEEGVALCVAEGCDGVVGLGGGSVIDSGKAISALVTNGGRPIDYMEVIGGGQSMSVPALPYIAIPTTAGTGAEASKNAVVASVEHAQKVSLRSEHMLPRVALVDPELTTGCPPHVTASCGLDALCHCLECYVTHLSTPLTDGLAAEGIRRSARSAASHSASQRASQPATSVDTQTPQASFSACVVAPWLAARSSS
eukprot:COSAG01_NODE_2191_length_8189_cov_23.683768_10_plen_226_part_00